MARNAFIELPSRERIPILYEDRSVLAIDKPAGWMLVPLSWQKTNRNLHAALLSSIAAGHFWARTRNLKFLRHIHRLDAETSGILLLAKSIGALKTFEDLFESRRMEKVYLAVIDRPPTAPAWTCRLSLAPDRKEHGRMTVDERGKPAETEFRVIAHNGGKWLLEARPYTGRTHQIRVHLARSGCPVISDDLYGHRGHVPMGLRAVGLAYRNPFTRQGVVIRAPLEVFLATYGFGPDTYRPSFHTVPTSPSAGPSKPDAMAKLAIPPGGNGSDSTGSHR